jgi:hypothetical protein
VWVLVGTGQVSWARGGRGASRSGSGSGSDRDRASGGYSWR